MAPRARRRGMTLVEIMIALVLLGIISGVIMRVIMRQQRFYQAANQIMTQRSQLRQATSVLPVDLRSLSSVGGDILTNSDSLIEFRVNVGTGVVCEVVDATHIALPPTTLANGQTLTAWQAGTAPATDGSVLAYIYDDGASVGNEDDTWQQLRLKNLGWDTNKCVGVLTGTISILDAARPRPVLELSDGTLSPTIVVGAPVRLTKRVQYGLYQESNGKWYLGYSEYDRALGTFKQLDPVSGPYDPKASGAGAESGLAFRYYTVDGVEVSPGADSTGRASIARVDLIVRGRTSGVVRAAGIQNGLEQQYRDSLAASVMLRNRT